MSGEQPGLLPPVAATDLLARAKISAMLPTVGSAPRSLAAHAAVFAKVGLRRCSPPSHSLACDRRLQAARVTDGSPGNTDAAGMPIPVPTVYVRAKLETRGPPPIGRRQGRGSQHWASGPGRTEGHCLRQGRGTGKRLGRCSSGWWSVRKSLSKRLQTQPDNAGPMVPPSFDHPSCFGGSGHGVLRARKPGREIDSVVSGTPERLHFRLSRHKDRPVRV